jgi:hypothetical protein
VFLSNVVLIGGGGRGRNVGWDNCCIVGGDLPMGCFH